MWYYYFMMYFQHAPINCFMKKLVSLFFILFLILTLICCSKTDGPVNYQQITIHYIDSTGYDLFHNGANGYNKDSVLIYSLQNSVPALYLLPYSMYPHG